jgi:hypothetical protein
MDDDNNNYGIEVGAGRNVDSLSFSSWWIVRALRDSPES